MTDKTQVMIATLAGSCFVVITQLATIPMRDMPSHLHTSFWLFAFAIPILAVSSFNVPRYSYSKDGCNEKLAEALLFLCAFLAATGGFFLLFFNFGSLTGMAFLVGVILSAIVLFLHGKEN